MDSPVGLLLIMAATASSLVLTVLRLVRRSRHENEPEESRRVFLLAYLLCGVVLAVGAAVALADLSR